MSLSDMAVETGALRSASDDPRRAMADRPMSRAQKLGVATTLLLTVTDGYDILAMSFAAPSLTQQWGMSRATLGIVMAMNLVGMGLGSILISPLADRFGRRRLALVALCLIAITMLASAAVQGPIQLAILRLITGLCIGGMVGATLSLATEYANSRNRALTASIMSIGMPIGGMIGALASSRILLTHDWRMIFLLGGVLTALVALVSCITLPESIDFLMLRRDVKSRKALDRILLRYGLQPLPADFVLEAPFARGISYAGLFLPQMRGTTISMIAVNFAMMATIYFLLGWLPQIIADMGFTGAQAATVSVYQNLGGIVGALALGWAARRHAAVNLTVVALAGTALTVILIALTPANLSLLRLSAAIQGFMALACSAGIYGVLASAFPPHMRSTGIGVSFGFGRIGTIAATIIPGLLFTAGWSNIPVASAMSGGAIIAMLLLFRWNRTQAGGAGAASTPVDNLVAHGNSRSPQT